MTIPDAHSYHLIRRGHCEFYYKSSTFLSIISMCYIMMRSYCFESLNKAVQHNNVS